jgi:carboxynorspermidine decarboxylase
LAGDVFGDYQFDDALGVGSRLCFLDVGSYSLVKANMFNGVPMPHLYLLKADGSIDVLGEPTYEAWIGHYS